MHGLGTIDGGIASRYQDKPADDGVERYRGRFQLVDALTGEPLPNQALGLAAALLSLLYVVVTKRPPPAGVPAF